MGKSGCFRRVGLSSLTASFAELGLGNRALGLERRIYLQMYAWKQTCAPHGFSGIGLSLSWSREKGLSKQGSLASEEISLGRAIIFTQRYLWQTLMNRSPMAPSLSPAIPWCRTCVPFAIHYRRAQWSVQPEGKAVRLKNMSNSEDISSKESAPRLPPLSLHTSPVS
jgi:hypothetical protein